MSLYRLDLIQIMTENKENQETMKAKLDTINVSFNMFNEFQS